MAVGNLHQLLVGKDEGARSEIARRVGEHLRLEDLPEVEQRAAEALARHLVADAVERVRGALAEAVSTATYLPRDVALKIAHDVDAVACPFLQATDVFSEADWKQLVLTVSRGARVAVASRPRLSEGVAVVLAEVGDSVVTGALVENPAAPMTRRVCETIMDRSDDAGWVLDALAQRDDLFAETAAHLITKVSSVAQAQLTKTYGLTASAVGLSAAAESGAMLKLIGKVPVKRLPAFVKHLRERKQFSHRLLLEALRDGSLDFFDAAVADLARLPLPKVRHLVDHGNDGLLTGLLSRVEIPQEIYSDIWEELKRFRGEGVPPV